MRGSAPPTAASPPAASASRSSRATLEPGRRAHRLSLRRCGWHARPLRPCGYTCTFTDATAKPRGTRASSSRPAPHLQRQGPDNTLTCSSTPTPLRWISTPHAYPAKPHARPPAARPCCSTARAWTSIRPPLRQRLHLPNRLERSRRYGHPDRHGRHHRCGRLPRPRRRRRSISFAYVALTGELFPEGDNPHPHPYPDDLAGIPAPHLLRPRRYHASALHVRNPGSGILNRSLDANPPPRCLRPVHDRPGLRGVAGHTVSASVLSDTGSEWSLALSALLPGRHPQTATSPGSSSRRAAIPSPHHRR